MKCMKRWVYCLAFAAFGLLGCVFLAKAQIEQGISQQPLPPCTGHEKTITICKSDKPIDCPSILFAPNCRGEWQVCDIASTNVTVYAANLTPKDRIPGKKNLCKGTRSKCGLKLNPLIGIGPIFLCDTFEVGPVTCDKWQEPDSKCKQ